MAIIRAISAMNAEITAAMCTLKKAIPILSLRVLEQVLHALIPRPGRYAGRA